MFKRYFIGVRHFVWRTKSYVDLGMDFTDLVQNNCNFRWYWRCQMKAYLGSFQIHLTTHSDLARTKVFHGLYVWLVLAQCLRYRSPSFVCLCYKRATPLVCIPWITLLSHGVDKITPALIPIVQPTRKKEVSFAERLLVVVHAYVYFWNFGTQLFGLFVEDSERWAIGRRSLSLACTNMLWTKLISRVLNKVVVLPG